MQDNLSEEVLARGPDAEEEDGGVNGGEEGTIEPATTLTDEFGDSGGDVGRGFGTFDVTETAGALVREGSWGWGRLTPSLRSSL